MGRRPFKFQFLAEETRGRQPRIILGIALPSRGKRVSFDFCPGNMVETKLVLCTLQFKIIQVWEAYWVLVQNTSNGWTFHEAYYFLNNTFQMGLNYLTNSPPISRIADKVIHDIRRPRCTMYPHILKTHYSGNRPQKL